MTSLRTKVLLFFAAVSALCCGGYYGDWNEFNSYFNPEATGLNQEFRPYFYSPNSISDLFDFYDPWYDETDAVEKLHVGAWAAWLGSGFTSEEIRQNLYGDALSPAFLKKVKRKSPEGSSYLEFLQSTTKVLTESGDYEWEEKPVPNHQLIKNKWKFATERSLQSTDVFLKERYGYLAVRLAWQSPVPQLAIETYDQLILPLSHKTYLSDWARSLIATSYALDGKKDRSLFEFAMVFRNCPSRRREAVTSIRFLSLAFSEAVVGFAKSNEEKEAVFSFLGILPNTDNLPYAIRLAGLNPQHPMLKLILSREINRSELYFPSNGDSDSYPESPEDSLRRINVKRETLGYQEKLNNFTAEMAAKSKGSDQAFWLTAQSYLHYLKGENGTALTLIEKARQIPDPGDGLAKQMAAQELLLVSLTETWMTPELEKRMVRLLGGLENDSSFYHVNARNTALLRLANFYEKESGKEEDHKWWSWSCRNKDPEEALPLNRVKAFLLRVMTTKRQSGRDLDYSSQTSLEELCNGTSAQHMQDVLDLVIKSNKTDVETKLVALARIEKDEICFWTARRYLAEHQYAKSAELFARLPESLFGNEYESYARFRNPFCVRMPFDTAANPKTPAQFSAELVKLEALTKTAKGDDLANAYYQLGCGEFNLSFEGTAWYCVKSSHSWSDLESLVPFTAIKNKKAEAAESYLQNNYITTGKALEYFEKSVVAAIDKDIKARSMYMAARCMLNRQMAETRIEMVRTGKFEYGYFYIDSDVWQGKVKSMLANNKWIHSLQNFAPQTKFHQLMIRECSVYNDYFGENSESNFF